MVFLAHGFSPGYQYLEIRGTFIERVLFTISSGETGVSIFFVLSGFLITYLLLSEQELKGNISVINFYVRRVLRIWPLYYAVLIVVFLFIPYAGNLLNMFGRISSTPIFYFAFLSNFDVINILTFHRGEDIIPQSITWSVAIEEQFYAFWPLIVRFTPKKLFPFALILIILGSFVFRLFNYDNSPILYYHTFSVLMDLSLGGLFAYMLKNMKKVSQFFSNTGTVMHLVYFLASFGLLYYFSRIFSFPQGEAVGRIFVSISFAFIITAQSASAKSSFLNLGNFKIANKLGKFTYGIYLIHPIALFFVDAFLVYFGIKKDSLLIHLFYGFSGLTLTLFLSAFSYNYYEAKFLKLKDKFAVITRN
jgi:peptidoglycan/LPS O-acetylase OafA/YrhL